MKNRNSKTRKTSSPKAYRNLILKVLNQMDALKCNLHKLYLEVFDKEAAKIVNSYNELDNDENQNSNF